MEPRVLTEQEVRDLFLKQCRALAHYWITTPEHNGHPDEIRRRVEGAIFSALVILDGGAIALPKFKVIPDPHPDDKAYCKKNGENWFPDNVDIAGSLHGGFYNKE